MSLASCGYVAILRCPVIFDGANYAEVVALMRIHMRDIHLRGVLSSEVPCPPRPVPPVAPTPPPAPPALDADASDADRAAARVADDDANAAYDQEVLDYSNALSVTIWLLTLNGVMMMLMLRLFSLQCFASVCF